MFAYIRGELVIKGTDHVVIDVSGVGYKIYMPATSIDKVGEIGKEVKVHTHYHVTEDNISLYGFCTLEELRMFELLIGVSGIGAKSANAILGSITPSKFALCVITDDIKSLTKLPGIGNKSAQRIILELKDKLKTTETTSLDTFEVQDFKQDNNLQEAISALQVLGYPAKDATTAVSKVYSDNLSVEDIIKKALIYFTK